EASIAEVHADVREGLVARVVEDEIAGSEVLALDGPAGPALRLSGMREPQPRRLLEGVGDETAAIEASLGRAAPIGIACAEGPQGMSEGTLARRGRRR